MSTLPMPRCWIRCENTQILMEMSTEYIIQEWRVIGWIFPRKVYENMDHAWYVFTVDGNMLGEPKTTANLAMVALEEELDRVRGYLAETKQDPSSGDKSNC